MAIKGLQKEASATFIGRLNDAITHYDLYMITSEESLVAQRGMFLTKGLLVHRIDGFFYRRYIRYNDSLIWHWNLKAQANDDFLKLFSPDTTFICYFHEVLLGTYSEVRRVHAWRLYQLISV